MVAKSKELLKYRKKREISESLAAPAAVAAFECKTTAPCHKTSAHGIAALAVNPADANVVATAGADGSVALFDAAKGKRASLLTGHSKKCTDVAWVGGALLSSSADGTVKLWNGAKCAATMGGVHTGEVVGISVHPTNAYACSIGGGHFQSTHPRTHPRTFNSQSFTDISRRRRRRIAELNTVSSLSQSNVRPTVYTPPRVYRVLYEQTVSPPMSDRPYTADRMNHVCQYLG